MALIKDKKNTLTTVYELIDALAAFPKDMPLLNTMQVHRLKPTKGEHFDDRRGVIVVEDDSDLDF